MDVIETVAKVVLAWSMLSLAMGVAWARFMGNLQRMETAVARDRTLRLSAVDEQRQTNTFLRHVA